MMAPSYSWTSISTVLQLEAIAKIHGERNTYERRLQKGETQRSLDTTGIYSTAKGWITQARRELRRVAATVATGAAAFFAAGALLCVHVSSWT